MIITTCKGNGWRQEIKPWGYHQVQKQATGIVEGLKISHEIKSFQFLDNTCFYGRLRYPSDTTAPYGFHIKLNLFGIFLSHSISCSVWYHLWGILDLFVLTVSSNINFPSLLFPINDDGILTTVELGLTPRDQRQNHTGWMNSRIWACHLLEEMSKYKAHKLRENISTSLRPFFLQHLLTTNWHLPRALPMTEQAHLPSPLGDWTLYYYRVDLQQPLRAFRVEWGPLSSRESGGTGL